MLVSSQRNLLLALFAWLAFACLLLLASPAQVSTQENEPPQATASEASSEATPPSNPESETEPETQENAELSEESGREAAPNSLTLTELAPILRNPWVGIAGGLLLMLVLRFIYNYGRR